MTSARHSKNTPRWGTPQEWVQMARFALGGRIELDPMSEPRFNAVVKADWIYTRRDDGLGQPWRCSTMLLNPAGGLVVEAWRKLVSEYMAGHVRRAIWIGFSVEHLNILADEATHPDDFSKLTVRKRIAFDPVRGKAAAPTHGNYVVGLGIAAQRFERTFAGRGRFGHGRLAVVTSRADEVRERAA